MAFYGYAKSAFDHGITSEEIDYVIAHYPGTTKAVPQDESDEISADGNTTVLFVGFSSTGRLLEVKVELLDEMDWVFHADKATSENEAKFALMR